MDVGNHDGQGRVEGEAKGEGGAAVESLYVTDHHNERMVHGSDYELHVLRIVATLSACL